MDQQQSVSEADRRVYPRSPVVVREARCISGMEVFFGYAQNVSRSGLFIATSKRRSAGDVYDIQFSLPGSDRQFHCKARVVWVRPYRQDSPYPPGFGLQFIDLDDGEATEIEGWVSTTESKPL